MRNLTLIIGLFFLLAAFTNAQNTAKRTVNLNAAMNTAIQASNQNPGQTVNPKRCGTTEYMEYQKSLDPTLELRLQQMEEFTQQWIMDHPNGSDNKTIITVPVVVHVIYNNSAENISDLRVQEQIDVLNRDYAGLNTHSMGSFSTSLKVNTELQFCLARKDPKRRINNGYRERSSTHGPFCDANGYPTYEEREYSTGGLDTWDPYQYMNIWVCNLGSGLCGYAQTPSNPLSSTFGVSIHYLYFGCTGASYPYNQGGTTTHEIGHCFNLKHIWGDDGGACTGTDYCNDTPNQADANYGTNSGVLTDACTSTSPGIMYMNFLDYSDDAVYANFTPEQKSRIQACFTTGGPLHALASSYGCTPPGGGGAPVANFTASATSVAPGTTVTFTDQSTNTPTSWSWTLTPSSGFTYAGGTSSSSQNPQITFNTLGTYTVALQATNSYGSNTCTKTNYITVTNTQPTGCDTILPGPFTNPSCSLAVYVADAVTPYDSGFIGGQNAYLDKEKAILYTGVANGTVSDVYVMYALKKGTTGTTTVKIYSSNAGAPGTLLGTSASITKSDIDTTGQGINFNNKYHFSSPVSVGSDYFVSVVLPTGFTYNSNELAIWTSQYTCTTNTEYELWSDDTWHDYSSTYGSNIDMAILPEVCTQGGVNDKIDGSEVKLFPNPAKDEFSIIFLGAKQNNIIIDVYNMIGERVTSVSGNNAEEHIVVNMADQTSGVYVVNIKTPQGTIIKKLSLIK